MSKANPDRSPRSKVAMKVLLDACVPRPVRKFGPALAVHSVQEMGWGTVN